MLQYQAEWRMPHALTAMGTCSRFFMPQCIGHLHRALSGGFSIRQASAGTPKRRGQGVPCFMHTVLPSARMKALT
jgi:hypothetical protein